MLGSRSTAIALLLALSACQRLSSDERKLIGTWETGSMDAVWRVTFKPDHTVALLFADFSSGRDEWGGDPMPGTWHLQGSHLTTEVVLPEENTLSRHTDTIAFV